MILLHQSGESLPLALHASNSHVSRSGNCNEKRNAARDLWMHRGERACLIGMQR
jgi:hypothetical protein